MSMKVADSRTYLTEGSRQDMVITEGGCWSRRSGVEKKMIFFIVFLLLLALSLSIALGVINARKSDTSGTGTFPQEPTSTTTTAAPKHDICNSTECMEAAKRIKTAMNASVSPCDDFFSYACGSWLENTNIPLDKGQWGTFDDLRVKLARDCVELLKQTTPEVPKNATENTRSFYQECVETEKTSIQDGNTALMTLLESIGGTPFFPKKTKFDLSYDWAKSLIDVRRRLGFNLLMSLSVDIDIGNPTNYIIYLDQASSFGLGRLILRDMDSEQNKKYIDAYANYIRSTVCLLGETTNCTDDFQKEEIRKLIIFEAEIAKLTKDQVLRRDPNVWYVKMSVSTLQKDVPISHKSWEQCINGVLETTEQTINESTEIVVKEVEYLKNLIELVNKTEIETVANYIGWRVLQAIGPYSSKDFRVNEFNFNKVTMGIMNQTTISDKCFDITNNYYGYALGSLYVQKIFSKDAKEDMEKMEANVADAFRKLLEKNDWMDNETKEQADLKLKQMEGMIGYPDWIERPEELNQFYRHLESTLEKGKYIVTLQNVLQETSLDQLSKLNGTANRTADWISQPTIVNAFYNPSANTITFPAGILQPPFYQHNTLQSLNYGGIGYVIGHEITHGYDDQGSLYDGIGKLKKWWSDATRKSYDGKKECLIQQYSDKTVQIANETINLNGNQTIGENIADNGGIREAFQAYLLTGESDIRLPGLEDLDSKKLFFLSAANIWCTKYRDESLKNQIDNGVHSPGKFRATIPLANTDDFAKVFNCPKGSAMNPENKCVLW